MKKVHLISRPTSVDDVTAQYADMEDDMWQQKAERYRVRRYRDLKNKIA